MVLCLASSNWLTAEKYRQGLWEFCVDENAPRPLPFGINVEPGCYPGRDVGMFYFLSKNSMCVTCEFFPRLHKIGRNLFRYGTLV